MFFPSTGKNGSPFQETATLTVRFKLCTIWKKYLTTSLNGNNNSSDNKTQQIYNIWTQIFHFLLPVTTPVNIDTRTINIFINIILPDTLQ